jgi:hypothetical protein
METSRKKKWIKAIVLGPRQILFGLEMDDARLTDLVLSCIAEQCAMHGQANLFDIITEVSTRNSLPESEILQIIFGFVHELKLCFCLEGQQITALDAKQKLLETPDTDIRVVLNKKVSAATFNAVQQTFQLMGVEFADCEDQHGFAFSALYMFERWHYDVKTFYTLAGTRSYPGRDQMARLLAFTGRLLQNQTAHSVLTDCFKYKNHLPTFARKLQKIRTFYTKDIDFWDQLVKTIPQFGENLSHIKKNPEAAAAYSQLADIVSSHSPFDRIQTARVLFDTVNTCHQQIESRKLEDCRQQAKDRIDAVITRLTADMATHNIDPDMRNHILLSLRQTQKKISSLPDIRQVNRLCSNAIDLAMDQFEDLVET